MATQIDWPALLGTHPELSFIPATLRAVAARRSWANGGLVFRRGSPAQAIHFLLTGEVRLVRRSPAGDEVILQRTRRGFFAEASLESGSYHCDAVAIPSSEVLSLPLDEVRTMLDTDAAFRRAWISHLSRELRRSRMQCERLALKTARERIFHYCDTEGVNGEVTLAIPTKAWAAELGLTHEALYRALTRLETEGLIARRGSTLRLVRR